MVKDEGRGFAPPRSWRIAVAGAVFLAVVVLDQLSKLIVRALVSAHGGAWGAALIPGLVRFQFVANIGAAFSLGEGMGGLFVVLALAVTAFALYYLLRAPLMSRVEVVGLALVAGGAIGNAIDRALFGFVTDFIATEFIDFPVFNVADIGITVGVVVAFFAYLLLSPANKVDATAELNRRDAEDRARRAERARGRAARAKRRRKGE